MYGGLLVFPFRDPPLFTYSVFSKRRHKQMFLFPLRNPWQPPDTGSGWSCAFLYIIDDSGPQTAPVHSHIDYHTVRGFWSWNFPFLNRNNSSLNN